MFYRLTSLKLSRIHIHHLSFVTTCIPHHFVFFTLEADDAATVADSIWTDLAAAVLQLQDTSVPHGTGLHLSQTHIITSNLHTGRSTGGTLP